MVSFKKPVSAKTWLSRFRDKTTSWYVIKFFTAQLCILSLVRILSVQQAPLTLTFGVFLTQLVLYSPHPDKQDFGDINLHFLLDMLQEIWCQLQISLNKVCLTILMSQNMFFFLSHTTRNTSPITEFLRRSWNEWERP